MGDILKSQIKLMSSEVLSDTGDGGGQMTSNEIVSGNVNNAFPDSSRLDKTYGRVSLRKAFLAVQTDNRACYYGSHIALVEQAKDPLISVCLFTTEDWFDTRDSCKKRIEGYLVKGPMFPCGLWGDHYSGSKSIQVFLEKDWEPPEVGEVLVLIAMKNLDGEAITPKEQFIRITEIDSEIKSLADGNKNRYDMQVLTISFGDKLLFDLPGTTPENGFKYSSSLSTLVHTSVAADTSKYYGVTKLKKAAVKNDLQIQVDEIRKPLVPSAQSQNAITDFGVGMSVPALLKTSTDHFIQKKINHSSDTEYYAGFSIAPGTLDFSITGDVYTDNSKGDILNPNNIVVGIINYGEGHLSFKQTPYNGSTTVTIKALPAYKCNAPTEAGSIFITEANRGFVFTFNCLPVPGKGTLRIDYISSGKWYSLFDQGTGEIRGIENGTGSGIVNFDSGSVSITLGGLPDIGSHILIYWGAKEFFKALEDINSSTLLCGFSFALTKRANYGTINIQLDENRRIYDTGWGTLKFENSSSGFSEEIGYYQTWNKKIELNNLPEGTITPEMSFSVTGKCYDSTDYTTKLFNPTIDGNTMTLTLSVGSDTIIPKTIRGGFYVKAQSAPEEEVFWKSTHHIDFYDNGEGVILSSPNEPIVGSNEIGTINYSTGVLTIQKKFTLRAFVRVFKDIPWWGLFIRRSIGYANKIVEHSFDNSGNSTYVRYVLDVEGDTSFSEDILTTPKFKITKPLGSEIIPGTLNFVCNNQSYIDLGTGNIKNFETENHDFEINYSTGVLIPKFESFTAGLSKLGGLISFENTSEIFFWTFRCPGAPLTPGSFSIQATKNDGSVISATAGLDGIISAQDIVGDIDYITGIVNIYFGNRDENNDIIYPDKGIRTSTIKMNCVVQTYIPLDAELLGLNPVKLPIDGKVPVFRDGEIVLIHHTRTGVVASPVAGQVVNLRTNTNLIELYDNNGVYIPETGNYSVDTVAGTLTFEDPLDLSSYTSPFQVLDRIEDMVLATDVQITGHIAVSQPLQHDYPTDDPDNPTLVSSVLPIGDMQSRIYNEFTDSSWNNKWLDIPQYNPTTAKYDLVNYPVIVTNKGAVKERFACIFTAGNKVNVVGEHLGVILANAPVTTDIAPVNPATGQPYFRIRHEGWGSGWSSGQVFRFNSDAANFPVWFCRTTQQGPATENDDHFTIQMRGDSA